MDKVKMPAEDDTELLRRYAHEQSQAAFAELVQRHLGCVYATALRRTGGRSDLAADATQQAFIALARQAHALIRHPTVAGWLYTTTRRAALGLLRSERARKLREEAHAMQHADDASAAAPPWSEIRPQLDDWIDQLDAAGRDAVVRRFFLDQKFAEMGAELRISEDAARMRVERALERLRTRLYRRGIESTTAALATLLAALPAGATVPAGLAATVTNAAAAVTPLAAPVAVVAVLNFMNTTKAVGLTCGLAVLVGSGGAYLAHETTAAQAQLQSIARTAARRAAVSPPVAPPPTAPPVAPAAVRRSEPPTVKPFVPVPMTLEEEQALRERFSARSPELERNLQLYSNRIRTRMRFHAIYAELGLSQDQIERFEMLATTKHLSSFGNLIGTPAAVQSFLRSNLRTLDTVVTETLGSQFVPAFRAFVATSELRGLVGNLAACTYYTEAPLTAALTDRLLQTCAACRTPQANEAYLDPADIDWPAALAQAQYFLAPAQLDALRALVAKQQFDLDFKRITGLPLRRPIRGNL